MKLNYLLCETHLITVGSGTSLLLSRTITHPDHIKDYAKEDLIDAYR